eukprot:19211_1
MSEGSISMPTNLNTFSLSNSRAQTPNGEAHGAYGILTNSLHARSKRISHDYMPNTATPTSHLPMPSPSISSHTKQRARAAGSPSPIANMLYLPRAESLPVTSTNNTTTVANENHLDERINALKDRAALIATNVSVNAENTTTNTRNIAANKEAIASDHGAITSHTKGIDTNARAIAAAVENIASNNSGITANVDGITANQDEVTALKTAMTECASTHEAYVTQTDDRLQALEDRLFGMSPVTDVQKPGIFGELRWFRKHRDEWVVVLLISNVVLFACLWSKCITGPKKK